MVGAVVVGREGMGMENPQSEGPSCVPDSGTGLRTLQRGPMATEPPHWDSLRLLTPLGLTEAVCPHQQPQEAGFPRHAAASMVLWYLLPKTSTLGELTPEAAVGTRVTPTYPQPVPGILSFFIVKSVTDRPF